MQILKTRQKKGKNQPEPDKLMLKNIFIGTSGYSYPHWKQVFYPDGCRKGQWLEYYAGRFNSVELNVTFYRLPKKDTFLSWYNRTPADFVFILKGSRYITHIKKLEDCAQALDLFFERSSPLKEKLRCILWQLPPSLKKNRSRLNDFLALLTGKAKKLDHCFEFRHSSWLSGDIFALLEKYKAGLCIPDSPDYPSSDKITSDFLYFRFHGSRYLYSSGYTDRELKKWVDKTLLWLDNIQTLYAFFNNDQKGFALKNALSFRDLLDERI